MTNLTAPEISTKQLWELLLLKPVTGEYAVYERATGTLLGHVSKMDKVWSAAPADTGWVSGAWKTQEAAARYFLPMLSEAPSVQYSVPAVKAALWKDRADMKMVKLATLKFDKSKKTGQDRDVLEWTLLDAGMLAAEVEAFIELKVG